MASGQAFLKAWAKPDSRSGCKAGARPESGPGQASDQILNKGTKQTLVFRAVAFGSMKNMSIHEITSQLNMTYGRKETITTCFVQGLSMRRDGNEVDKGIVVGHLMRSK